ncbi:G protein-coupled receptor-4 [Proboscivirus elephantidbeta4]|uniref:G protein-coupled receptor-4 n=1 Tax=Elephant endotheliotropic herpesvirus 4 TaxID=548914 RepID=A0A0S1TRQ6_9BETA|nr:G protein-coupled receptor-4 [Elephant endotheliotropic herpesvirus 4]ALM25950.1 G protein-coupled receptor-4 [Elephant endotheliotropic herpesvirus 4]
MLAFFVTKKTLNVSEDMENEFFMRYMDAQAMLGTAIVLLIVLPLLFYLLKICRRTKIDPGCLINDIYLALCVTGIFLLSVVVKYYHRDYTLSVLFGIFFAMAFSALFTSCLYLLNPGHYRDSDPLAPVFSTMLYSIPQLILGLQYALLCPRLKDIMFGTDAQKNVDFISLLPYVMALLLAVLVLSIRLYQCGRTKRQHYEGLILLTTSFVSFAIWTGWVYIFVSRTYGCIPWSVITIIISNYNGWAFVFAYFGPKLYIYFLYVTGNTKDLEGLRERKKDDDGNNAKKSSLSTVVEHVPVPPTALSAYGPLLLTVKGPCHKCSANGCETHKRVVAIV